MKYWNQHIETMPVEQLRKIQFQRFKNIFAYAYENSPAYRELYDKSGVRLADLMRMEDIQKVPLTGKGFITANLSDTFCYGATLSMPPEKVVFYHQTSGTTSKPVRAAAGQPL